MDIGDVGLPVKVKNFALYKKYKKKKNVGDKSEKK